MMKVIRAWVLGLSLFLSSAMALSLSEHDICVKVVDCMVHMAAGFIGEDSVDCKNQLPQHYSDLTDGWRGQQAKEAVNEACNLVGEIGNSAFNELTGADISDAITTVVDSSNSIADKFCSGAGSEIADDVCSRTSTETLMSQCNEQGNSGNAACTAASTAYIVDGVENKTKDLRDDAAHEASDAVHLKFW